MLWLLIYTIAIFFWSTSSKTEAATIVANPASTTGLDPCNEKGRETFEKKHVCEIAKCVSEKEAAEFSENARGRESDIYKNTVFVPFKTVEKVKYKLFNGENDAGENENMCQATVPLGFKYECQKDKTKKWTCTKAEGQECKITFATSSGHLMLKKYKPSCHKICSEESKLYGIFSFYHICAKGCCTVNNDYTKRLFINLRKKSKDIKGPILVPNGAPKFNYYADHEECREVKSSGWKSFECGDTHDKPCTEKKCESVSWNPTNGHFSKCNN